MTYAKKYCAEKSAKSDRIYCVKFGAFLISNNCFRTAASSGLMPARKGAVYHLSSRRRSDVNITPALREKVVQTIAAIREIIRAGKLPKPVNDRRRDQCSLKEICQSAQV